MSSAARQSVAYLPIDLLIAHLEDTLEDIAEIRSRNPSLEFGAITGRITAVDERSELSDCAFCVETALALARAYAKGPSA